MTHFIKLIDYIFSPLVLFVVCGALLVIYSIQKNNNFFDISGIFKEQFSIFKDCKYQFIVFYLVPALLSIGIIRIKYIDDKIVNNLNIVLSIFVSMFFAMLSIISSFNSNRKDLFDKLLKETYNSIMFEIILAIFILMLTFTFSFISGVINISVIRGLSFFIYYFTFVMLLNIFIVLKRMKALFENKS